MQSQSRPRRLHQQISVQHVGDETLIYDERSHRAFCLNAIAASVWELCDGSRSTAEIAQEAALMLSVPVTEDLVRLTLAQLQVDGLLRIEETTAPLDNVISRRSVMTRLATGAALLLPVITVIAAPKAAQAYNGCVDCPSAKPQQRRRKQKTDFDFSDLD